MGFINLQEKPEKYVFQCSVDILNINKIEFVIPFSSLSLSLVLSLSSLQLFKAKASLLSKNIALLYFTQIEQKKLSFDDFFMTTLERENERKKAWFAYTALQICIGSCSDMTIPTFYIKSTEKINKKYFQILMSYRVSL